MFKKILNYPFFIKLFHWEYWPFHALYGPIYPIWLFQAIKTGSFFFINTSNPKITNGGFLMESKKEIYDQLPINSYPKTILIKARTEWNNLKDSISLSKIKYPMIAKPDIGMRGMGVKKILNEKELKEYAQQSSLNFLVQEFITLEKEVGIFYIRIPGEEKGFISGIVGKEFLTITGNGKDTIQVLLSRDPRYVLQIPFLSKEDPILLDTVLNDGVKQLLVPYGNHARGAKFLDYSNQINPDLTNFIDNLCKQIPEFYFGRIDMRYDNWESLCKGESFSIIELNGAGSEPTHIYDPKHSIFFAWREIVLHWKYLQKISSINHKIKQLPYMKFRDGIQMLKANKTLIKTLENDWH
jgi:hypothetical protein